ncbi:retrovirus-related pol polyprotein from transposon TNT 1-94 [Tanacetum coccineum]
MKGYVEQLERLDYVLPQDLSVGLILNGLTSDFAGFVRNYNMHNMGKTIGELHAMLIEYEKGLPKKAETPQVMAIRSGKIQKANKKSLKAKGKGKANGKGKYKQVYIPKPKNPKPSAKEHPAKDDTCHHCKEVGHWKRNCPVYLPDLLKKKKQVGIASSSGIFTIELFSFPNKSCVYDTSCGTHICITKQGLRGARKLEQGALYLYVGNGVRAQVEAIRSFDLVLPNGLVICLDNCHYAPTITRGIVSVHCLVENGFIQCFTDYGISVSKNDVLYFNVVPRDGKMTRKHFPHRTRRVTDLLGIIHTDVCGPLRHVSRQACGIVQHLTPLYTPQHNGVSERRNRTLLDIVRSMMNLTTLLLSFWDYALEFATRILNMVPTKKVDKTPYELWYEKVPNLSYLKVWGCEALMKPDTPDKLQQRSVKCIFIGYPKETISYYFYFPPEHKIVVARYVEFFKKSLITLEVSGRAIDLEEIQDEDTSPSEITSEIPMDVEGFEPPQEEVILIRRSERTHRAPNRLCLNVEAEEHSLGDLTPTSYKAVMLDLESKKWLDAMNAEMQSMEDNQVWHLVDLPPNSKDYTQLYRVDYKETFSPVADIRAIRILIAIAAFYDYEICILSYVCHIYMQERLDLNKIQGASTPEEVKRMQNVPYALVVGSVMYAVRCTRPDIAFAQNITSRFQQNPGEPHWTAVKNILKYLRNTKDMFLVYGGNPEAELRVDCYCDAGFETDKDDIKSQTGYVFVLNGGAVDWKSSKQSTIVVSAIEAEYIVVSEAAMEAVWIRKFISGPGIVPTINEPIKMFCDNSSALLIANEPGVQKGARHYHRRYHYVRECIELGEINLLKVHTYDNLADPFTKALPKVKLTQHARSIGLRLASSFM